MSEFEEDIQEEQKQGDLPPVHHIEPKLFIGVVTLILLAVYVVVLFLTESRQGGVEQLMPLHPAVQVATESIVPAIPRVDLGQVLPQRFSSDFAPATSTPLMESYELTYDHGVQSTVVYATTQPVLTVLADFKARLQTAGFVVVNTYESSFVAALYAMKEKAELNITIVSTPGTDREVPMTQVTISHFDK